MARALNIAVTALLTVLVAANLYVFAAREITGRAQPTVFGYAAAVVLSGSMEPAIHVNDMVVIHREAAYEPQDVILYGGGQSMVTHRIVELKDGVYITRGDSNNTNDPAVLPEQVVGRVVLVIPKIGAAIGFMRTPLGMLLILTVLLLTEAVARFYGKRRLDTTEGDYGDDAL